MLEGVVTGQHGSHVSQRHPGVECRWRLIVLFSQLHACGENNPPLCCVGEFTDQTITEDRCNDNGQHISR